MAYESKAGFLISLEKRMAEEMTANEMNKALRIVADVIEGYELTEHAAEDIAAEDDLLESFLAAMRVSGRSQKTIDRYDYIIRRMMETVMKTRTRHTMNTLVFGARIFGQKKEINVTANGKMFPHWTANEMYVAMLKPCSGYCMANKGTSQKRKLIGAHELTPMKNKAKYTPGLILDIAATFPDLLVV